MLCILQETACQRHFTVSLPSSPKSQDGAKYIYVGQDYDHVGSGSQARARKDIFFIEKEHMKFCKTSAKALRRSSCTFNSSAARFLQCNMSTQLSGYIVSIPAEQKQDRGSDLLSQKRAAFGASAESRVAFVSLFNS